MSEPTPNPFAPPTAEAEAPDPRVRAHVGPDGVPFVRATLVDRAAAHLIDVAWRGPVLWGVFLLTGEGLQAVATALVLDLAPAAYLLATVAAAGVVGGLSALFEAGPWRATPGKHLLGLWVARSDGSDAPARALLLRQGALSLLLRLNLAFGFLVSFTVSIDPQRGVWNRLAGTDVLTTPPGSTDGRARRRARSLLAIVAMLLLTGAGWVGLVTLYAAGT